MQHWFFHKHEKLQIKKKKIRPKKTYPLNTRNALKHNLLMKYSLTWAFIMSVIISYFQNKNKDIHLSY